MVQQTAWLLTLHDAFQKYFFFQRCVGQAGFGQDGVLAEQSVKLASHEGLELGNFAAQDMSPFAVSAWQNKLSGFNFQCAQCAENLNFFATHHIGRAVIESGQARHYANAVFFDPLQVLSDVFKAARAGTVGRFTPTLPAARHARNKAQRIVGHPICKALFKNVLKLAMRNLHDALRKGALFKNCAIAVDECTSQRRSAPVNCNKLLRHAYFFNPSKA